MCRVKVVATKSKEWPSLSLVEVKKLKEMSEWWNPLLVETEEPKNADTLAASSISFSST